MESKQIAIYSRKSRFTGKGESIGNQAELCRDYIRAAYGQKAAGDALVFEDEGFSGGNLNRPGFRQLMQAAEEHRLSAVVVYRLDRISRNISDFANLIQILARLEVAFVSIREQFDTATPMGRAMMYIASVFSQLERETIAERIRDNMRELAKTGRWLGGVPPTGYTSERMEKRTDDGKNRWQCKLKPVPEETQLVQRIFALYLQLDSLTAVQAELLRQGTLTKNGRPFTRYSLKGILQNPVYVQADETVQQYFRRKGAELCSPDRDFDGRHGILAYNRTDQQKGRATHYLPEEEWIITVGQHPGLVTSADWLRVQRSLQRNRSASYRKPRSNRALLTGRLFCSCGGRMYPKLTDRTAPDGNRAFTYFCRQREDSRNSRCSCSGVSGNQLDNLVLDRLGKLVPDYRELARLLEKPMQRQETEMEQLQRERSQLEGQIRSLVDSLSRMEGSNAADYVRQRIEELHNRLCRLKSRMEERSAQQTELRLAPEELAQLKRDLLCFGDCLTRMQLEEKRNAIRTLLRRTEWDGEKLKLFWAAVPGWEDSK